MQLHCGDAWLCDDDPVQPVRVRLFLSFWCIFSLRFSLIESIPCPSLYYFRFYVFEPKSNYRSRSFITLPSMRFESPSDNLGLWIFRNIREFRKFTPWKNPGSGNSRICSTYYIGYLKMSVSDYRCTGLSKRTMKYYNNMNLHRHKLTNVD